MHVIKLLVLCVVCSICDVARAQDRSMLEALLHRTEELTQGRDELSFESFVRELLRDAGPSNGYSRAVVLDGLEVFALTSYEIHRAQEAVQILVENGRDSSAYDGLRMWPLPFSWWARPAEGGDYVRIGYMIEDVDLPRWEDEVVEAALLIRCEMDGMSVSTFRASLELDPASPSFKGDLQCAIPPGAIVTIDASFSHRGHCLERRLAWRLGERVQWLMPDGRERSASAEAFHHAWECVRSLPMIRAAERRSRAENRVADALIAREDAESPAPIVLVEQATDGQLVDGEVLDLRGRVHVLHFWTTWCPPCRAEMPVLDELQREFPQIAVVSLCDTNVPRDYAGIEEYEGGGKHRVELASAESVRSNQIRVYPTTIITDGRGMVRLRYIGSTGMPRDEFEQLIVEEAWMGFLDRVAEASRGLARVVPMTRKDP
jgi:thiol-disulfide isomerase/thioredoxin